MKKLILASYVLLLTCGHAFASVYRSLAIMTTEGTEHTIAYQEGMKMSVKDQTLTLTGMDLESGKQTQFSYSFDNITGFKFSEAEGEQNFSGVDDIAGDATYFTIEGTTVIVNHLAPNTTATVYSTDGRLLLTVCTDSSGQLSINLEEYPNQLLIVKAGNLTYKTIIRK